MMTMMMMMLILSARAAWAAWAAWAAVSESFIFPLVSIQLFQCPTTDDRGDDDYGVGCILYSSSCILCLIFFVFKIFHSAQLYFLFVLC